MSQEAHAREGAQAALPDDEVIDVAVVMPRGSTLARILGATAGGLAGGSNSLAWGVVGSMVSERMNAESKQSYPSLVLALSPSRLYVLGRTSSGLVGGWNHLRPIAHIERSDLEVTHQRHGTVLVIGLTDTTTGSTLEVEAQNIGGLGLKDLLGEIETPGDSKGGESTV